MGTGDGGSDGSNGDRDVFMGMGGNGYKLGLPCHFLVSISGIIIEI